MCRENSHHVVQVKVGDSKPAYMAIASAPAAKGSEIELLVKNQGPTAELLCSVKEGAPACTLACYFHILTLLQHCLYDCAPLRCGAQADKMVHAQAMLWT